MRWVALSAVAVVSTIVLMFVAAGKANAWPSPSTALTPAFNAHPRCESAREAAGYYRLWTWRWQDEAQVARDVRGYRPGVRARSCNRARALMRSWRTRAVFWRHTTARLNGSIRVAIRAYFGAEAGGATVVANCETGGLLDNPAAALVVRSPGSQYVGIFQMSDRWEIQRYGRWRGEVRYATVVDQVAAAARMWRARTWQAWACRPDGSVAY